MPATKAKRINAERQHLLRVERELAKPQPATLSERVNPLRRRKHAAARRKRQAEHDRLQQLRTRHGTVRRFQSSHRRAWRGIVSVNERMRLERISRTLTLRHADQNDPFRFPRYRDPQARRRAREARP